MAIVVSSITESIKLLRKVENNGLILNVVIYVTLALDVLTAIAREELIYNKSFYQISLILTPTIIGLLFL